MLVMEDLVKDFGVDAVEVTSREYILSHVRGAVVPANDELLNKGVIYRNVLDLALIYKVELEVSDEVKGAYNLSYDVMNLAGLSEDELFEVVRDYKAYNMKPILATIMQYMDVPEEEFGGIDFDVPGVYVFSNADMHYGAAALVSDVLLKLGKRVEFYVLPCSKHELILVDNSLGGDVEGLKDMVKMVNSTELAPEDYLSDSVYYLDANGLRILA
ncbi:DUF5688 family protein [Pseudobutyrivibrio ruminis]|uniref:Uncharacterized protein n=1 Tax=Pseudobutyrivibrio ruminis TaxID=46206 RepID=A0A2G3DYF9_9FIRM|nr:DUF5688 family protein [Pseudobutyrivibrio ruminis]PHU35991.1 hypothetical protein CSX01_01800 [Pseudobutyrivibrio ruminis]